VWLSHSGRSQVAFAGAAAAVIRGGVVEVAAGGGSAATGCGAGGIAGPDQMLELPAGLIARFLMAVVARAVSQGADRDGEAG
jgi:hypothetical protein